MKRRLPSFARLSFPLASAIAALLAAAPSLVAQTTYDWFDTAPDGNWRQGASGARWTGGLFNEPPGGGILQFNNNHQLTMNNNVAGTYNQHCITFGSSNTSVRTLGGNTVRLFDFSGADPNINNNSSATHIINLNLEGDGDAADPLKVNLNSTGGLTFGGTINNQGSTIDVQGTGSAGTATFNGVISGAGGMTKANANTTLVLAAQNTYTGSTTISGGTLQAAATNALGSTSGITVNTGGTLLLSGSGDRIGNTVPLSMSGGRFSLNAQTEGALGTAGVGLLTNSGTSVIDFGQTTTSVVAFGSIGTALGGTALNVWNWDGTTDKFYVTSGTAGTIYPNVNFFSGEGSGGGYASGGVLTGSGSNLQLVPVPEIGAVFGALGLLAPLAWRERRHWMRCAAARA